MWNAALYFFYIAQAKFDCGRFIKDHTNITNTAYKPFHNEACLFRPLVYVVNSLYAQLDIPRYSWICPFILPNVGYNALSS